MNGELLIYEESPEGRMPELVELVPRVEGNQEVRQMVERGRGIDPAPLESREVSQPEVSEPGSDPDSESDGLDLGVDDQGVHDPPVVDSGPLDPEDVIVVDQENEGAGSWDSEEEIIETTESESPSEEEEEEDSEESPGIRKSERVRARKKVFSKTKRDTRLGKKLKRKVKTHNS